MTASTGWRAGAVLWLALSLSPAVSTGEPIVSSLRNTNAVTEANGFRLLPAFGEAEPAGSGDLAPPQSVEIIRPDDRPLTLGRLFTSSRVIRVEAAQRTFGPGERAFLIIRNLEPTPPDGQIYTIYVQLVSPIRTTLKFDAFVQSLFMDEPEPEPVLTEKTPDAGLPASPPAAEAASAAPVQAAAPAADPATAPPAAGGPDGEARREPSPDQLSSPGSAAEQAAASGPDSPAGQEAEARPTSPPAEPELTRAPDGPPAPERDPALPFVSLITIGVSDMSRAGKFYENIGWRRTSRNPADPAVFFQLNGQALVLYPLPDLLREQNMSAAKPAPGGITLALHVAGKDEVTEIYRKFLAAGAAPLREPTEMPSGAVTCYVADPDGNPWEISWVPRFRMDAGGGLWLP